MSPEGPRFSPNKDKKNNKDAPAALPSASLKPLIAVESAPTERNEKRVGANEKKEPSPLEKALADLAARQTEATMAEVAAHQQHEAFDKPGETGKSKKSKKGNKEAELTPADADEAFVVEEKPEAAPEEIESDAATMPEEAEDNESDEQDESEDGQSYEALPNFDPEPTEFSGGEVVIHLSGDEPVAERVVPLRAGREEVTVPIEAEAEKPTAGPEEEAAVTEPDNDPESTSEEAVIPAAQPEQQAETQSEEVPEPATGGGGEEPPVPPEQPTVYAEQPHEPEYPNPQEIYEASAIHTGDTAPITTSAEGPATKQDIENALYYAEKAGQRRGLLTGLLAGGAYEHFKHKRRERKLQKQLKQQDKKIETTRQDHHFDLQQQAAANAETERRLAGAETAAALTPPPEAPKQSMQEMQEMTAHPQAPERVATLLRPERVAPFVQSERRFTDTATEMQPEQLKKPEQLPKAEQLQTEAEQEEQLKIPPEHRLETSAWHSIEVDARTGKPVEKPSFEYGHEYHRERAHEGLPQETVETASAAAAVTALTAAGADQPQVAGTEQTNIPDATMEGQSVKPVDKVKAAAGSLASGAASSGPLWPWLIALGVIVLLLGILL